jgi:hypothetical protein
MIEVKYDDFPAETGGTLRDKAYTFRDRAGTLVTGQSMGSLTEDGASAHI